MALRLRFPIWRKSKLDQLKRDRKKVVTQAKEKRYSQLYTLEALSAMDTSAPFIWTTIQV